MKFLIQKNLIGKKDLDKIIEVFETEGIDYELVEVIPFSDELSGIDLKGLSYCPYGSTSLTNISYSLGLLGLHFDLETFNYEAACLNRDDMLNRNVMRLDEAIQFFNNQIDNGNGDTDWFVRPSEDLKQFTGCVIPAQEAHDWFLDMVECATSGTYKLEPETKVVVCEPKKIYSEARFFIVGGKIVEGSVYRVSGDLYSSRLTEEEYSFHQENFVDGKWLPDQCCVMDVADTPDGYKVIEFNCLNSAGMYDCDVGNIFRALWKYHHQ